MHTPRPRLPQFAAAAMARQHSRVLKRGRRIESWHSGFAPFAHSGQTAALQRRVFSSAGAEKGAKLRSRVVRVQDLLGRFNDNALAWQRLDTLARRNGRRHTSRQ